MALADLSLAGVLALPALGLTLAEDAPPRVAAGLSTLGGLLDDPEPADGAAAAARREVLRPRVGRLARAETLDAGQRAYAQGMTRRRVPGWVRVTGPAPCALCAGLAARAEVLPPDWRMATHAGCSCVQRPTDQPPVTPPREE